VSEEGIMASIHITPETNEHFEHVTDEVFLVTAVIGAALGAWLGFTVASGGGEVIRLLTSAMGVVTGSVLGTTLGRRWLLPRLSRWERRHFWPH
jgi:membrane protein DedA with SNARE-associated domain